MTSSQGWEVPQGGPEAHAVIGLVGGISSQDSHPGHLPPVHTHPSSLFSLFPAQSQSRTQSVWF